MRPIGKFGNRSPLVQEQLLLAQEKMEKAGIVIVLDPNNLIVISNGLHKSLHTDEYLLGVSNAILSGVRRK